MTAVAIKSWVAWLRSREAAKWFRIKSNAQFNGAFVGFPALFPGVGRREHVASGQLGNFSNVFRETWEDG